MTVEPLFITPEILDWTPMPVQEVLTAGAMLTRPFDMLRHAEHVLANDGTDAEHRVDVVTTLKRAIDHRLQAIAELYRFKRVPIREKPEGTLETLQYYGAVRKRMLDSLIQIRNDVEHRFASPPDVDRCADYLEFVWYFLRSTNPLVRSRVDILRLERDDDTAYSAEIESGPVRDWVTKINVWLPASGVSRQSGDAWIAVRPEQWFTRKEFEDRLSAAGPIDRHIFPQGKDDDVQVVGTVIGPASAIQGILRILLDVA